MPNLKRARLRHSEALTVRNVLHGCFEPLLAMLLCVNCVNMCVFCKSIGTILFLLPSQTGKP